MININPDPKNGIADSIDLARKFDKYSGYFLPLQEAIVGPLDTGLLTGVLIERTADRQAGDQRQGRHLPEIKIGPENQSKIETETAGRMPASPMPPPPASLPFRDDQSAFGGSGIGEAFGQFVGRGNGFIAVNLAAHDPAFEVEAEQRRQDIFRQTVQQVTVGGGIDFDTGFAQMLHAVFDAGFVEPGAAVSLRARTLRWSAPPAARSTLA